MEAKRKPGIYLVTDTGAEIELILADADGQETLLSKRTPAEDLVSFVNRDFSEYQRKVNALWETHPLFEPHNDVLPSEYLDFIAKALPLTEMIRELDPAAYLDVTLQAAQAQAMEDNGDPLFLSRKGAAIEQALSTPFRIQNRLRNLFEIVFAYSERDTQQERFQTLEQTWPGIIDRDYAVRFIPCELFEQLPDAEVIAPPLKTAEVSVQPIDDPFAGAKKTKKPELKKKEKQRWSQFVSNVDD